METPIHYDFLIKLKPKTNQSPQHVNVDQPPQQAAATTFSVLFLLYKQQIYSLHGAEFFATDRRPEPISRKIIHIPAGDSPCRHINDFKDILTGMGILGIKRSEILFEIATKAHDHCNGVFMSVIIRKKVYREMRLHNEEDDIARAERESMEVGARPVPATKSSIDALERVVFDVSAPPSASDCAVCMEEISAGSEAIRMPCWHVYHSDCIVQWLQTSHLCPLCRYHMPCE